MLYVRTIVDTYGMNPPWNVALATLVNDQHMRGRLLTHIRYLVARKEARPLRKN